MADKTSTPQADGHSTAYELVFVILIIVMIGGAVERLGLNNFFVDPEDQTTEERQIGPVSRLFGSGEVDIEKLAITKGLISVRSIPGGSVIGTQTKRTIGILKEGPLEQFGTSWWRMDFKDAPDGWVDEKFITANISGYRASQIIPIIYDTLKPIGIGISILLSLIILYFASKRKKAYIVAEKKVKVAVTQNEEFESKTEDIMKNKRWHKVEELMKSNNINDWKQAIIESDVMLEEMLDRMGYDGETVADKLKNVEESDFVTLNKAWEAHKVRNKIAHSGTEFVLEKGEAERVIGLYKKVFREFYYI